MFSRHSLAAPGASQSLGALPLVITFRGLKTIPADQAWFWSPVWQAGEREADREIAAGDLSPAYGSAEDMFADLDRRA